MNKDRRQQLRDVKDSLDEAISLLNDIKDEEQDAFDNLPENFQESERATRMTEAIDEIDEAISSICLLYTSPSPRDLSTSRMPSSA